MSDVKNGAVREQIPMKIRGDDAYPVWHRRPLPLDAPRARYFGFKPETVLLRKGEIRREGAMPLPCDINLDRDVALTLRDGTVIYTDVFRPALDGEYPSIVSWSPYGKEVGSENVEDMPGRSGVPMGAISELNKFEAVDPAFWVNHGYVVLNPDTRGAYKSGGNLVYWGRQLAEDGYDFIEWAAVQPWSSGKVAMAGNSFLAASQWAAVLDQIDALSSRIASLEKALRLEAERAQSTARLMSTPGMGPITAMAVKAFAPTMATFRRGETLRSGSAWC